MNNGFPPRAGYWGEGIHSKGEERNQYPFHWLLIYLHFGLLLSWQWWNSVCVCVIYAVKLPAESTVLNDAFKSWQQQWPQRSSFSDWCVEEYLRYTHVRYLGNTPQRLWGIGKKKKRKKKALALAQTPTKAWGMANKQEIQDWEMKQTKGQCWQLQPSYSCSAGRDGDRVPQAFPMLSWISRGQVQMGAQSHRYTLAVWLICGWGTKCS